MVLCSWIAPQGALAQLPLPIGSLIVTLTSPASGSTVSGTVTVSASVSIVGSLTVAGVQFKLDGANLGGEATSSPYSVPWNTTTASNGSHTLTAVARDTLGVLWTSNPVTVAVANDATPPTVTINKAADQASPTNAAPINFTAVFSKPVSGFTGSGVTISGTAGGSKTVTVSGGPSTYNVAVSGMTSSGTVIATVAAGVAHDAAGNSNTASTSTDNSVTFDITPPTVSITSLVSGATVSGTITVTASASDNIGVVGVQFQLDGINAGAELTAAPYSVPWDTTTSSNGSHTITAVARDAAGNRTTSAGVTVTVSNGTATVTRFEENSPAVRPSGTWVLRGPEVAAFSGGTAGSSDVPGATVTFTFTGTAVSWIGLKCSVCGIATVSIDGGAATSVDTAGPAAPGSPGLTSEVVFTASGLAASSHSMVITVTGTTTSGGANIVVDAFDVTGGSAATRIKDTDPAVSYTGTWVHGTSPLASGGTYAEANLAGAVATLSFTGTGVGWLSYRNYNNGIARASVDGVVVGEVDTYAPSAGSAVVFTATGFPRGAHTLTIEVTGTKNQASTNTWVIIDAFDVTP
jgi:hypothetical protein